jgi:hypothetical protein
LAVSESLSALPRRASVWRTPSAAFHDSDESELSYKAAANSKKPLARWMPELYLLIVILLAEDLIHHEDREGPEERTTEGILKTISSFVLFVCSFENTGRRGLDQFKAEPLDWSFPHGVLESRLTWMFSGRVLANLDAGYPCRHERRSVFSCSVDERKIMNHFVVVSIFSKRRRAPKIL